MTTTKTQTTATAKREARDLFAAHGIAVPARDVQASAKYIRIWLPTETRIAALAIPGVVEAENTSFVYIIREA